VTDVSEGRGRVPKSIMPLSGIPVACNTIWVGEDECVSRE